MIPSSMAAVISMAARWSDSWSRSFGVLVLIKVPTVLMVPHTEHSSVILVWFKVRLRIRS